MRTTCDLKFFAEQQKQSLLYTQSVYLSSYVQASVSIRYNSRCLPLMGACSVIKVKRHFECPQLRSPCSAAFLRVERPVVGNLAPDQVRHQAAAEHLASLPEI